MNASGAPVTSRLILTVLSLILVCLVLLVVRAYRTPERLVSAAPVTVAGPVQALEPTVPRPPKPITFVPRQMPTSEPAAVTTPELPAVSTDIAASAPPTAPAASVFPPPLYTPGGSSPNASRAPKGAGGAHGPAGVVGTVLLLGTPPPEIPIALGPSCGRLNPNPVTTRHYVVNSNGALANVLVYVSAGLPRLVHEAHEPVVPLLDQIGCMFEPYVVAVQTGVSFKVRNSDPEMHNIHLTPRRNRERNFGQPVKGQVNTLMLDQPELFVRIKCDVHPWMFAYVSVLDHPYFAVTDTNGGFALPPGLPAGKYTVTAAHLKTSFLRQDITLAPGESKALMFRFEVPDPSQARVTPPGLIPVGAEP